MLETIAVILIVLWLLGMVTSYTMSTPSTCCSWLLSSSSSFVW